MAYNPSTMGTTTYQLATFGGVSAGTASCPVATGAFPVATNAVAAGTGGIPVTTGVVSVATGVVPSMATMIGATAQTAKVEQPQMRQASVQYAKTAVRASSPAPKVVQAGTLQVRPKTVVQGPSITFSSAAPQVVTSRVAPVQFPGQQAAPVAVNGSLHAPHGTACHVSQQMPRQGCYAVAQQGHASYQGHASCEVAASPVPPQGRLPQLPPHPPQHWNEARPPQPPTQPPERLTEGMPDPAAIEQQKYTYARSLDVQLEQGTKMLEQQNEVQKHALRQAAEQQKHQYNVQVDQQLKAQEMSVDQQASYQLMGLQQAAHEQRTMLEQQANAAILDYEQKKVQDEFARQQYEYQRKAYEKHVEMHTEMQRHRENYVMQTRALQEAYAKQTAALQQEAANAASSVVAGAGAGF